MSALDQLFQDIDELASDISELEQAKEIFDSLFYCNVQGMVLVSPGHYFIKANKKAEEIFEMTEAELLQTTFDDRTYAVDLDKDLVEFEKMQDKKIKNYNLAKRYYKNKSNKLNPCHLMVSAYLDDNDKPKFYFARITTYVDWLKMGEPFFDLMTTDERNAG